MSQSLDESTDSESRNDAIAGSPKPNVDADSRKEAEFQSSAAGEPNKNGLATPRTRAFFPSDRNLIAAAGTVILLLGAGAFVWIRLHQLNPLLATPQIALENLSGTPLYFNAPARQDLIKRRPDLLTDDEKDAKTLSPQVRSFAQAVENPQLFRQLDRQTRFGAVLLAGDPTQYRPLLDHLLDSADWKLWYLDHTSLVFKRGAEEWSEAKLEPVRQRFAGASSIDRARFLANVSRKLVSVRRTELAKKYADEAVALEPKQPDGWVARADVHMGLGEWNPAAGDADRALSFENDFLPALAVKAQALYASKHFADAFHTSQRLIEKLPNDPGALFYHAKISHEARAFGEEADALMHLIALAEKEGRPVSGYEIYLGQAYAHLGNGAEALEAYNKALSDPDITGDQRKEVQDAVASIQKRIEEK